MHLIAILLLLFVYCTLGERGKTFVCGNEKNTTMTGKWRLIKYHNLTSGGSEAEPANISRSVIIEFSDDGHIGKMNGHTVTNTVFGEYELMKGNKMKISSLGGTEVGETGWGHKFRDAIRTAISYERYDSKLFIFFNAGSEKMEFRKE